VSTICISPPMLVVRSHPGEQQPAGVPAGARPPALAATRQNFRSHPNRKSSLCARGLQCRMGCGESDKHLSALDELKKWLS